MEADKRDLRSRLTTLLDKASGGSTRLGDRRGPVSRRDFLQLGAVAGAGASLSAAPSPQPGVQAEASRGPDTSQAPDAFNEATIAQLQAAMARGRTIGVRADEFLSRTHSGARREGTAPQFRHRAQPRRARHCQTRRCTSPAGTGARAAPWDSHPAEGQHRHRRQDADDRRLVRAQREAGPPRFHRRRQAARRRRRHSRESEPERMGEYPLVQLHQRVERTRRPDRQPLCPRPQSLRLELRVGRGRVGELVRRVARHRDRWQHRLPVECERRRRPEADGRADEPRRRGAHLPYAGHGGTPFANGRRCGCRADGDRESGLRRTGPCHRRRAAWMARAAPAAAAADQLHAVRQSQRPAGCAHRRDGAGG